jgi:hypothetical protein
MAATSTPERIGSGRHLLLVVDHRVATVYEFEPPAEVVATVTPYDPRGYLRHLHHIEGHFQSQRAPEDLAYYRAIADAVRGADTLVIFGHGDGHSSAAAIVRQRITEHLSAPAPTVVEARIDAKSLTEPQLLAAERRIFDDIKAQDRGEHS